MSTQTKNKMNPAQKATKGSQRGVFNKPNDSLGLLQKGGGIVEQGVSFAEDIMANQKRWLIEIQHLATKESVVFKSFLTEFADAFNSSWESEEIFGRMDPIQIFKNTKRVITIGWDVPANDLNEARYNMIKMNSLMKMLYPVYGDVKYQTVAEPTPKTTREINSSIKNFKKTAKGKGGQQAAARRFIQDITKIGVQTRNFGSQSTYMVASPLLKMKFTNLISQPGRKVVADVDSAGLVGTVDGFVFEPDLEAGFFDPGPSMLFPKVLRLSCNFTVLHTHKLGYAENKTKSVFFYDNNPERFPYSITDAPPPGRKPSSFYIAQERERLKKEAAKLAAADEAARKKRAKAQARKQAEMQKKLAAMAAKEEADRKKALAAEKARRAAAAAALAAKQFTAKQIATQQVQRAETKMFRAGEKLGNTFVSRKATSLINQGAKAAAKWYIKNEEILGTRKLVDKAIILQDRAGKWALKAYEWTKQKLISQRASQIASKKKEGIKKTLKSLQASDQAILKNLDKIVP